MSPFHIDHAKLVLHVLYIVGFWNTYITMFCLNAYACTHICSQLRAALFTAPHRRTHTQTKYQQCPKVNCLHSPPVTCSEQTNIYASLWQTRSELMLFCLVDTRGPTKHAIELCLGKATMWTCWQGIFQLTATWTRFRTSNLDSGLARGCM